MCIYIHIYYIYVYIYIYYMYVYIYIFIHEKSDVLVFGHENDHVAIMTISLGTWTLIIPVVPHKAVAEVSKIGNL